MGKKARKTRWRKLPIAIGTQGGHEHEDGVDREDPPPSHSRITFNEDEYTKITTPRQDMLFKKGYLSKKKTVNTTQPQDPADSQGAQSSDSVESEQYMCEEAIPQYVYPAPPGYMDPSGLYFISSNSYEIYDPYMGNVTMIVGPPQYGGAQPLLAAVPCQPVLPQPYEWFNPPPAHHPRKKTSSTDSQNGSAPSSESTCPPSSPQEPIEGMDGAPIMYPQPQYVYPGYMFGAPLYNMNGVSVQGVLPQPGDTKQRRKKRRRRRRGGVTDEGSESSCEEQLSCEVGAESQSGASSDAGPGSSCSKTNSDSGIHTDPTPNSGSNSPQLQNSDDQLVDFPHPEANAGCPNQEVFTTTPLQSSASPCDVPLEPLEEVCLKSSSSPPLSPLMLSPGSSADETSTETVPENSLQIPECSQIERDFETPVSVSRDNFQKEDEPQTIENESKLESSEVNVPIAQLGTEGDDKKIETEIVKSQEDEITEDVVLSSMVEVCLEAKQTDKIAREPDIITSISHKESTEEFEAPEVENLPILLVTEKPVNPAIDRLATKMASEIVKDAIEESSQHRCRHLLPITEAVTKWLQSQGSTALSHDSEDEGIDEDEEESLLTGQKNVDGNPFLAPSLSGSGKRVAEDYVSVVSSAGEWDMYDSVGSKCDPAISVDKYYRLTAQSPTVIKTAVHIRRTGPFPCGVCCLIQ